MAPSCPPRGVYAPVVAFFNEDETLDFGVLKTHITRLAKAGVAGLVIQGSNSEAPHLLHSERQEVIATASSILKESGIPSAVIIAGCGAQSTREPSSSVKKRRNLAPTTLSSWPLVIGVSLHSLYSINDPN